MLNEQKVEGSFHSSFTLAIIVHGRLYKEVAKILYHMYTNTQNNQ